MGAITAKELLTLRLVRWLNRRRFTLGTISPAEIHYQQIFDAAVARSGLAVPPLFPVGNAANASLLYLLFRLTQDFPRLAWLELGAGQSTLLLDALQTGGRIASLVTLEHDPHWADTIRAKVGHAVIEAPLRQASLYGLPAEAYGYDSTARFDCVTVDGPVGTPGRSRWGTLKLLQENLAEDFVVIFDDAERPGERDTIAKFLELRPEANHIFVHAAKSQCVVFTSKYAIAGSY